MAHRICPTWLGPLLASPLRRFMEDPEKLFSPLVSAGMCVLEPGCGMGFFTLPLARLVGPGGRVLALDVQEGMLRGLRRRAEKAGLAERIEARLVGGGGMELADVAGGVDFAAVMHVAHELPDQGAFFAELAAALKPGGRVFLAEPRGHVTARAFLTTLELARARGFELERAEAGWGGRRATLAKGPR